MSLVALEGMHFYAYHGFYEEERIAGNDYLLDVYAYLNFDEAADEDNISGTVNYEQILAKCQEEMGKKHKLLETIASNIGESLLNNHRRIQKIRVRVNKLNPQMGSKTARAIVEFEKSR